MPESAHFTMDDWADLQDEALEVLDSIGLVPKNMNKEVKTNFRHSMNVGGLHSDSKSKTLHFHVDCCRVDFDGKTNDVHDIHIRAMKAAEIINMRRGWEKSQEIRDLRMQEIAEACNNTLRNMQQFDVYAYFDMLRAKGYEVKPRCDKKGKLVGYTIGKNASVFKASSVGRKYMVSQLENTWKKLHPKPAQVKIKPAVPVVSPSVRPSHPVGQMPTFTQPKVQPKHVPSFSTYYIGIGDEYKKIEIPNSVKDIFFDQIEVPEENETATREDITHVAMLLFAGYLDVATSMSESCGGGGSVPQSGWGKKDDEDDRMFASRCVRMAHSMCKPRQQYRFHR